MLVFVVLPHHFKECTLPAMKRVKSAQYWTTGDAEENKEYLSSSLPMAVVFWVLSGKFRTNWGQVSVILVLAVWESPLENFNCMSQERDLTPKILFLLFWIPEQKPRDTLRTKKSFILD